MIVTHSMTLICRCPENGRLDSYEITVETDRLLLVEDIEAAASEWLGRKVYQEQVAQALADRLEAKVTVMGHHGAVRSKVEASCST